MHNHTRDITATRPENFAELTEEEQVEQFGVRFTSKVFTLGCCSTATDMIVPVVASSR